MASEHWRPPPLQQPTLYPRRAVARDTSDVFSQSFLEANGDHQGPALDEEDRVLCLLLEAFPGIPHETLAIAYARANRDPNKAAEILSAETTRTKSSEASAQTFDFVEIWKPPKPKPRRPVLEEEKFCSRPNGIHFDDFRSKEADDTHQLKNGHGDFAGASVWRDSPLLASHSRPPDAEASSASLRKENENRSSQPKWGIRSSRPISPHDEGNGLASFPALRRNNATRSSQPNWGIRSSSAPPKLSAAGGSVSNQMQRRPLANTTNGSEHREVELYDGLYTENMVKKKYNGEEQKAGEDSGSGRGIVQRRAAEDFLHSMLGGEFGIDLVRDVLDHYEGDTEKALETLLNIGSTSSGFDYRKDAVDSVFSSLAAQDADENEEIKQASRAFVEGIPGLETELAADHEAFDEGLLGEEDESHRILLVRLCEAFPTVEQSFLAQVLQAAGFSFEGALQILTDSGMRPVGEQYSKPKLDPAEIWQALFKTKNEPPKMIRPFDEPVVAPREPWSVVAAKPRISRNNPDVQAMVQKLGSDANGEWNEYARHRATATEHWETMKMYMKQANAAYNQGDRVHAGILSEKGTKFKALAQAASARASQNIFNVRNKDIANNITIDLHSQHVIEALRLLQLHLRALSQIPSVDALTVITGQGSHSAGGQAKIKPAVTRYLDKKQVPWTQQNPGCILIEMSDVRSIDANQGDTESYSDSE